MGNNYSMTLEPGGVSRQTTSVRHVLEGGKMVLEVLDVPPAKVEVFQAMWQQLVEEYMRK